MKKNKVRLCWDIPKNKEMQPKRLDWDTWVKEKVTHLTKPRKGMLKVNENEKNKIKALRKEIQGWNRLILMAHVYLCYCIPL